MNTTTKAPDFPGGRPGQNSGYPSNGASIGPAWQDLWDLLRASPDNALNGRELASQVAPRHNLEPSTLVALLSRAAKAGLLEREQRQVTVPVLDREAKRSQTFYRIKADGTA